MLGGGGFRTPLVYAALAGSDSGVTVGSSMRPDIIARGWRSLARTVVSVL